MTVQSRVHVAVNGFGVIGKRVADAVTLQPNAAREQVGRQRRPARV